MGNYYFIPFLNEIGNRLYCIRYGSHLLYQIAAQGVAAERDYDFLLFHLSSTFFSE